VEEKEMFFYKFEKLGDYKGLFEVNIKLFFFGFSGFSQL
jgi:hypothetical protein